MSGLRFVTARVLSTLGVSLLFITAAPSQSPQPAPKTENGHPTRLRVEAGLVKVLGDLATIDLPPGWGYVQRAEALRVIEHVWGFTPTKRTVGLLLPPTPWGGFAVEYLLIGHVDDRDSHLDPKALAKEIHDRQTASNTVRKRQGLAPLEFERWTEPPHYDVPTRSLRCGQLARVADAQVQTYKMYVLGAEGVLAMTALTQTKDPELITAAGRAVLPRVGFTERYCHASATPGPDDPRQRLADLILGKDRRGIGFVRVILRPMIAVGVFLLAWFGSRRFLRRRSG